MKPAPLTESHDTGVAPGFMDDAEPSLGATRTRGDSGSEGLAWLEDLALGCFPARSQAFTGLFAAIKSLDSAHAYEIGSAAAAVGTGLALAL